MLCTRSPQDLYVFFLWKGDAVRSKYTYYCAMLLYKKQILTGTNFFKWDTSYIGRIVIAKDQSVYIAAQYFINFTHMIEGCLMFNDIVALYVLCV